MYFEKAHWLKKEKANQICLLFRLFHSLGLHLGADHILRNLIYYSSILNPCDDTKHKPNLTTVAQGSQIFS